MPTLPFTSALSSSFSSSSLSISSPHLLKMLDSAIMLFGRQIPLSAVDGEAPVVIQSGYFGVSSEKTDHEEAETVTIEGKATEETDENEEALKDEHDSAAMEAESIQLALKSEKCEIGDIEQIDSNLKERTSKKPDKILPCPRCKSMETKFCYYNNYNVNQPRYFCKACQRYWTSGGTMRNMAVGAGRRKNKNSPSACRHITVPETLQPVRINGKVLTFGSVASVPSNEEKGSTANSNGFEKVEGRAIPAYRVGHEISDDCSSGLSVTVSDSIEEGVVKSSHKQCFHDLNVGPSYLPFFPGVSWPCYPPGFPLSFYNGSYWNPPWFSRQPSPTSSRRDSPTLGKHLRDSDASKTCNSDVGEHKNQRQGSVLVPKTLRIDDPNDAAKSSIWATLGIKIESIGRGDMFRDFQSKGVERTCLAERSSVLQSNPAALTRSLTFHETA